VGVAALAYTKLQHKDKYKKLDYTDWLHMSTEARIPRASQRKSEAVVSGDNCDDQSKSKVKNEHRCSGVYQRVPMIAEATSGRLTPGCL
jgi:hypothetical protein